MTIKRKVRIDKDYCSSTVWMDGCNWDESDFQFNEEQLELAHKYDNLWENAHRDIYNVDEVFLVSADKAKFNLLRNLSKNRKDIEWYYWDNQEGKEVIYHDN